LMHGKMRGTTKACLSLSLAVALLLPAVPVAMAQGGTDHWPSYMGDERHSGVSSHRISGNSGEFDWKYGIDSPAGSPLVDKDGYIYQTDSQYVVKLDQEGKLVWSLYLGTYIQSNLALAPNGTVIACGFPISNSLHRGVFAISPNGTLLWNWNNDWVWQSSPTIGTDGSIYVGTMFPEYADRPKVGNSSLIALDPNGHLEWQYNVSVNLLSSPAIAPGGGIVFVSAGNVSELNRNGTLNWTTGLAGLDITACPSINPSGQIFVMTNTSLVCLDKNGTVSWTETLEGDIGTQSTPSCTSDRVIVPSGNGVYCFDNHGNLTWHYKSGSLVSVSVIIDADGSAIFASGNEIFALDIAGNVIWRHGVTNLIDAETGRPFHPVLATDGTVLIASNHLRSNNYLYALGKPSNYGMVMTFIVLFAIIAFILLAIWLPSREEGRA
jgi:hypothetical protein